MNIRTLTDDAVELTVDDFRILALRDGSLEAPLEDYCGIAPDEAMAMLRGANAEMPPCCHLTVYLVERESRRILVDAGAGPTLSPTAGRLPATLAGIGLTPGDIDTVVQTHLHGDHVAGLADADGKAVFPDATVRIAATEHAFWVEDRGPDAPAIVTARAGLVDGSLAPYAGRIETFRPGALSPGIEARALPGHTPGHTGLFIAGKLLIAADILHLPEVQFPRPEVTTRYDVDPARAAATRRETLDLAAAEDLLLAGMHFRWPPFLRVRKAGGGYTTRPATPLPHR